MFKKVLAITALLFASVTPVHAEDLSYLNRTIGWSDTTSSYNYPVAYGGSGTPCSEGWSTTCDPSTGNIFITNFLPLCESTDGSDKRLDCLDSVYVDLNGTKVKGELAPNQSGIWDTYGFNAKPEYGIAKASPIRIYKFSGLRHDKGDLFMVSALAEKRVIKGVVDWSDYTFLITPTFEPSDPGLRDECRLIPNGLSLCSGSFERNTKFLLNLKLATPPSGWFTGRITAPEIQLKPGSDGRTSVTLAGISQAVPSIARNFRYTKQSEQDEWNQIAKALSRWIPGLSWDTLSPAGKRMSRGLVTTSAQIDWYQAVSSSVPSFNNADALRNIWRIESNTSQNSSTTLCLKSGFIGMVSSNSLTYENAIPNWDAANKSLVYRIASPHTALGVEFIGNYDLLISEKVGKCLWNVSELSPSAEISVTSADGVKKVFTATSSTTDGYYKFVATGFTFSTNKISVKLVSKSVSTSSAKPSTITCIKGKVQKKVTAVKPKCPTGYKKK